MRYSEKKLYYSFYYDTAYEYAVHGHLDDPEEPKGKENRV